jgi:hypothetical protein
LFRLIVSIESAKSINYQLCGKKQHHKKKRILFLKAYFPKPAHRLPESSIQSKVFFPGVPKSDIDFCKKIGPHRQNPQTDTTWPV